MEFCGGVWIVRLQTLKDPRAFVRVQKNTF